MSFEDLHRPLSRAGFRGVTRALVVATGIAWLAQQFVGGWMVPHLGLVPAYVLQRGWWWQIITYLFLHGGLFHWLFNMFVLWMFGRELELRWGSRFFLTYLLVTGVGAGLLVLLLSPHSSVPTIGSSGAVFGVLVAFAMVFPEATLYLYFIIPMKAWQAAALFAFIELFAGLQGGGSGIAQYAHLGGMGTGYLYLKAWGWVKSRGPLFSWRRWGQSGRSSRAWDVVQGDLAEEVDRILEKVLRQGPQSLSREEKEVMERYSKRAR